MLDNHSNLFPFDYGDHEDAVERVNRDLGNDDTIDMWC